MRKAIAYTVIAGAVGMLIGVAEIVFGFKVGGTFFIVGAVLCFGGEMLLKYRR